MNWALIALLAGFGPVIALLWQQGTLPVVWIAIVLFALVPVACASWIATGTRDRHTKHGFIAGYLLWASFLAVSLTFNPKLLAMLAGTPTPPRIFIPLLFVVHGTMFASWVGVLAVVAAACARSDWYWFHNAWRWRLSSLVLGLGPFATMMAYGAVVGWDAVDRAMNEDENPAGMIAYIVFHIAGLIVGGYTARHMGRRPKQWVVGGLLSSGIAIGVLSLLPPAPSARGRETSKASTVT